jgi:hypothetical protein
MSTEETKALLYKLIENSDEKLIPILYSMVLEYHNQHATGNQEMLVELDERRRRHLAGESKSYSWEEAKKIITTKKTNEL